MTYEEMTEANKARVKEASARLKKARHEAELAVKAMVEPSTQKVGECEVGNGVTYGVIDDHALFLLEMCESVQAHANLALDAIGVFVREGKKD